MTETKIDDLPRPQRGGSYIRKGGSLDRVAHTKPANSGPDPATEEKSKAPPKAKTKGASQ